MPWKETSAVEERLEFVRYVLRDEESLAELCRRYGISRPTGYKWLARFEQGGPVGLEDRTSAPHRHPNELPAELAETILTLRGQHMTWGPRKLRSFLFRRHGNRRWPAASTIGQLLRRNGMNVARRPRHKTPPYSHPFAACDGPNGTWSADFKGWFGTGDGKRCYPLTITDAYSRYLIRCQGMEQSGTERTQSIFEAAFREYGMPQAIRTDNGPPFASKAIGGLSRLSVWWLKLGILPERIEPGKPQQNGRHERMHRTLKQETANPPGPNLSSQQRRFDEFRKVYNNDRPHEALGQRPPTEFYTPSGRPYPSGPIEPDYPPAMAVRSVRRTGEIKWQGGLMYLSEVLACERVGLDPVDDGYWVVVFCRMPLGVLDDRRRKIWNLETAMRRGLVARPALPSPFRCAPGAGQSVGV